jgi:Domain of unknown function (DUF4331)
VFLAKGAESRSVEAVGKKIVAEAEVSFGPRPNLEKGGDYTFFAGSRSDAFFFDFDGIKNLFDIRGKRNFTEPHLSGKSPWTGVDSNTDADVFSMVVELPTSELAPKPEVHIWGRCSVREDGWNGTHGSTGTQADALIRHRNPHANCFCQQLDDLCANVRRCAWALNTRPAPCYRTFSNRIRYFSQEARSFSVHSQAEAA